MTFSIKTKRISTMINTCFSLVKVILISEKTISVLLKFLFFSLKFFFLYIYFMFINTLTIVINYDDFQH